MTVDDIPRSISDYNRTASFHDYTDFLEVRFTSGEEALLASAAEKISRKVPKPVKMIRETKKGKVTRWFVNGINFNPFGGPAFLADEANSYIEHWTNADGKQSRIGGPSHIERGAVSDLIYYRLNGSFHREDGPARIARHFYAGNIPRRTRFDRLPKDAAKITEAAAAHFAGAENVSLFAQTVEETFVHGGLKCHHDRASQISANESIESIIVENDGSIRRKVYSDVKRWTWSNGVAVHRTTGPAIIILSNVYEEFLNDELLTRQCDGWAVEWWLDGKKIENHNLVEWTKRAHIILLAPYMIEGSVWRESQDEAAFILDFGRVAA